jgi:hypothetical protein
VSVIGGRPWQNGRGRSADSDGEDVAGRQRAVATVDIQGEQVPLEVRWNDRARRFILRLDAASGGARLTLPSHADLEDAIGFLKRHERWLMSERRRLAEPRPLAPDTVVPFRGEDHLIVSAPGRRRVAVARSDGGPELRVCGPSDMAAARLARWMKSEARSDLERAVARHAGRLEAAAGRIAIRDQRSRWGSCSTTGTLSFSWRLVMAPPLVLDYVAAHEVAHLREMNHGPRFWKLVRQSYGDYGPPRAWLRKHGAALHRYGAG